MSTLEQDIPSPTLAQPDTGRAAFLAQRLTGIGGSDASIVVGLNPYKTPFQLYLEKRGEAEQADLSDNAAVQWGNRLEDVVAAEYAERTGATVHRVNRTLRHPHHPHMMANLDRRIVGASKGLEVKTAGAWAGRSDAWGEPGTDQVPEQYLLQCQHYLSVTGYTAFDLAVLIAGQDFRIYTIQRDEQLISMLIEAESIFWRGVQDGIAPVVTTIEDARRRFPSSRNGKIVEATSDIMAEVLSLREMRRDINETQERADAIQARILAHIGDGDTLMRGAQKLASWKSQSTTRLDQTALKEQQPTTFALFSRTSESRVFRLASEAKGKK